MRASLAQLCALTFLAFLVAAWSGVSAVDPAGAARTSALGGSSGPQGSRERLIESVVRSWSARLNAGDNSGVAKLFSLPATMIQAPYVYRLTSRRQIALWESELPCSGRIVSIAVKGSFATAVFVLGNRRSSRCSAAGALAAARFEIVAGKIVSWEQIPVPPRSAAATIA